MKITAIISFIFRYSSQHKKPHEIQYKYYLIYIKSNAKIPSSEYGLYLYRNSFEFCVCSKTCLTRGSQIINICTHLSLKRLKCNKLIPGLTRTFTAHLTPKRDMKVYWGGTYKNLKAHYKKKPREILSSRGMRTGYCTLISFFMQP